MNAHSRLAWIGAFTAVAVIAAAPAFADAAKTEKKATHQKAKTEQPSGNSVSTQDTTPAQRTPIGY